MNRSTCRSTLAGLLALATYIFHIIGEASYSIYLTQTYVLIAAGQLCRRVHMNVGEIGLALLVGTVTLVATGVGHAIFCFVEEPIRFAVLERFKAGSRRSPEPAWAVQVSATIA